MFSCDFFYKKEEKKAVARVGNNFLYQEDIKALFSGNITEQDSINLVRSYINDWATKQLLTDKAIINLNEEKLGELEKLVRDYRTDLYINAYREALVSRTMDTTVREDEIAAFYNENSENFRLNEELLKIRYIHLNKDNSNMKTITERFKRFNKGDKNILDSLAIQFKHYFLNDSVWIKITQIAEKVPVISLDTKDQYLKKSQFFEIQDSLEVYLMYVKDVAKTYDIAPLPYIRPTIKQIILNRRKLEFIKELEKDIVNDAIQKKQFEIYE
ncbi:MAG: peptidyl-prolyl cis-trans isomerase [Sinomicrobium sp.]|nr:peptidyl-prolyl cis-trans isomerase [Sinomicrobium sp.]